MIKQPAFSRYHICLKDQVRTTIRQLANSHFHLDPDPHCLHSCSIRGLMMRFKSLRARRNLDDKEDPSDAFYGVSCRARSNSAIISFIGLHRGAVRPIRQQLPHCLVRTRRFLFQTVHRRSHTARSNHDLSHLRDRAAW